jgi:hypothetical protein
VRKHTDRDVGNDKASSLINPSENHVRRIELLHSNQNWKKELV